MHARRRFCRRRRRRYRRADVAHTFVPRAPEAPEAAAGAAAMGRAAAGGTERRVNATPLPCDIGPHLGGFQSSFKILLLRAVFVSKETTANGGSAKGLLPAVARTSELLSYSPWGK